MTAAPMAPQTNPTPLFQLIGGEWLAGEGDAAPPTVSPVDGRPLTSGDAASIAQANAALAAATEAFATWRHSDQADRDAVVRRFASLVGEHRDELTRLIAGEIGKTFSDAASEVSAMIGKAETSITARDSRTPTSTSELPAGTLEVSHRPLGPTVVLGPFNFPGHLPNGHITPALLAGNTVVFKPSEQGAIVGQRMVELWVEAGLPDGVINLVHGGVPVAEALIDNPRTASVLFTGGVEAGRAIHRRLGGRPEVMLALELGGNNPVIAWSIDDAEAAAALIVRSAFLSSGQRCTCARRLIVEDGDRGDAIVRAVTQLASTLLVGPPSGAPEPFMGPVVSARAAEAVLRAQHALVDRGGVTLLESGRTDDGEAYLTPGVIDVTAVVDLPDAEVFGPLLQVQRVSTLDEAIATANDTTFGLAAAVITDDDDAWRRVEPELEAGIVNRNVATVGASGAAPFGGIGSSGNHRPAGFHAADYVAHPVASLRVGANPVVAPIEAVSSEAVSSKPSTEEQR